MPTSGRGTSKPAPTLPPVSQRTARLSSRPRASAQAGFSLIELMVVLIIIAIAASMITVGAFPDRRQGLHQEAQRLVELFKLAQVEARADGRRIEWQSNTEGYRFMRLQRSPAPTPSSVRQPVLLPDYFEQDPYLRPRLWHSTPIRVEGAPLAFSAEWLLPPARIVLYSDEDQLAIIRHAAGHYEIQ